LLAYFKNLPARFGVAYDATKLVDMISDSPWQEMIESGEIVSQNLTNALLRATQRGYLERRGVKKGSIYRLSDKGRRFLDELENE
jgi:CTP-dependent riboflavin kinase